MKQKYEDKYQKSEGKSELFKQYAFLVSPHPDIMVNRLEREYRIQCCTITSAETHYSSIQKCPASNKLIQANLSLS